MMVIYRVGELLGEEEPRRMALIGSTRPISPTVPIKQDGETKSISLSSLTSIIVINYTFCVLGDKKRLFNQA